MPSVGRGELPGKVNVRRPRASPSLTAISYLYMTTQPSIWIVDGHCIPAAHELDRFYVGWSVVFAEV